MLLFSFRYSDDFFVLLLSFWIFFWYCFGHSGDVFATYVEFQTNNLLIHVFHFDDFSNRIVVIMTICWCVLVMLTVILLICFFYLFKVSRDSDEFLLRIMILMSVLFEMVTILMSFLYRFWWFIFKTHNDPDGFIIQTLLIWLVLS